MAYGTVNTDIVADSSGGRLAPISSVFRNRIINGAMVIDQRNAGASVTPTTNQYTVDRWNCETNISSKASFQQSTTAPAGFINSMLITSLSAYSVGSGDVLNFQQSIEGLNCTDLGWGTASAKTVTLSFWVQSSLTGTFGGAIKNSAGNRSYPFTYTISAANTWEQKTVTIAGDTSGTWLTTNGIGIYVGFQLGDGSTRVGTAGSWSGSNYYGATGATNLVATNGATFYITGVQLEVGSSATGFEYRQYTTELALCQRYYWKSTGAAYTVHGCGFGFTTTQCDVYSKFPVSMRTAPTTSVSAGVAMQVIAAQYPVTSLSTTGGTGVDSAFLRVNTAGTFTAGAGALMINANNATQYFDASAEL